VKQDVACKTKGGDMVEIKEMPYAEKYSNVLASINRMEKFVPAFMQKHLENREMIEFQTIWEEGINAIPEDASSEEKYELAYRNWIAKARNAHSFVRERLGEDGMEKFKRDNVDILKEENASPALVMLRLVRAISRGLAFSMTAKKVAYNLQWLSPYSVPELSRHRLVFAIPQCKILDFPDSEEICLVGCQSTYPMWLAEQFNVNMEANRQGNSCTLTVTPLS